MSQQFNIRLPHDVAEFVESKVKTGAYASVDEVVSEGVRALVDREASLEEWLRDEVVPGHAEYLADPSKGVSADELLDLIKSRRVTRGAT